MDNIYYNMKLRKEFPNEALTLCKDKGIITGSSLITVNYKDIDLAVFCTPELICSLNDHINIPETVNMLNINIDAAQIVFDTLVLKGYALYIGDNYRDSTFISCYIHNNGCIYNLLLMDEINVFNEWKYATKKLIENASNEDMKIKHRRVKFFEMCRKEYRRTLILP